ncbi:hypothetical protein QBC34DRAFT_174003 [Podospora aff. communis PSN243]|uniref:Uncharacterized protein n=1 Tax=Podospora aff. communis PSN243 TaxID=3040156 RepID=A0AAV9H352_9PEZI|nr:hypothetical protein QBC34DRAFT_174003 [Podospora aff. communis PSN243]
MSCCDQEEPTGLAVWFPFNKLDLNGWRFDVITLLAVIGESSVAIHAQTLTASKLCLLPRIIPAPQALLRPIRPQRLPEVTAKMAGVYGGTVLDTVGFFANIMHPLEDLKPFAFKVLKITHKDQTKDGTPPSAPQPEATTTGTPFSSIFARRRKTAASDDIPLDNNNTTTTPKHIAFPPPTDLESQQQQPPSSESQEQPRKPSLPKISIPRRTLTTLSTRVTTALLLNQPRYAVPPHALSPLHLVTLFSSAMTLLLFALATYWKDGVAMVAILAISLASSITCYASWWRPLLMHRPSQNKVPQGDVMIRTREGAFLLIRCQEEVARELYTAREECQYVEMGYHRVYMGVGMVLLMVAVVLLGNCGWNSQVLVGVVYIVLNGVYWVMGLIPARYFWDLSRYEMEDITPDDAKNADQPTLDHDGMLTDEHEGLPSFTRTLWYAIRETRYGAWVERSGAMPGTDQWKKWLAEATQAAWKGERDWPAVKRKSEIMKEGMTMMMGTPVRAKGEEVELVSMPVEDAAAQVAPLDEVKGKLPHEGGRS